MISTRREGLFVFTVAFLVRFVAAGITTLTTLNPDSTGDARGFARAAKTIAEDFFQGQIILPWAGDIYDLWGAFLAPF
jgi:hypothetical protein